MLRVLVVVLALLGGCLDRESPIAQVEPPEAAVVEEPVAPVPSQAPSAPSQGGQSAQTNPAQSNPPAASPDAPQPARDPVILRGTLLSPDPLYYDAGSCGAISSPYSVVSQGITWNVHGIEPYVGWKLYLHIEGLVTSFEDKHGHDLGDDRIVPADATHLIVCNVAMPAGDYSITLMPPERLIGEDSHVVSFTGRVTAPENGWRTHYQACQFAGGVGWNQLGDIVNPTFNVKGMAGWSYFIEEPGIVATQTMPGSAPAGVIVDRDEIVVCSSSAVNTEFTLLLSPPPS